MLCDIAFSAAANNNNNNNWNVLFIIQLVIKLVFTNDLNEIWRGEVICPRSVASKLRDMYLDANNPISNKEKLNPLILLLPLPVNDLTN